MGDSNVNLEYALGSFKTSYNDDQTQGMVAGWDEGADVGVTLEAGYVEFGDPDLPDVDKFLISGTVGSEKLGSAVSLLGPGDAAVGADGYIQCYIRVTDTSNEFETFGPQLTTTIIEAQTGIIMGVGANVGYSVALTQPDPEDVPFVIGGFTDGTDYYLFRGCIEETAPNVFEWNIAEVTTASDNPNFGRNLAASPDGTKVTTSWYEAGVGTTDFNYQTYEFSGTSIDPVIGLDFSTTVDTVYTDLEVDAEVTDLGEGILYGYDTGYSFVPTAGSTEYERVDVNIDVNEIAGTYSLSGNAVGTGLPNYDFEFTGEYEELQGSSGTKVEINLSFSQDWVIQIGGSFVIIHTDLDNVDEPVTELSGPTLPEGTVVDNVTFDRFGKLRFILRGGENNDELIETVVLVRPTDPVRVLNYWNRILGRLGC